MNIHLLRQLRRCFAAKRKSIFQPTTEDLVYGLFMRLLSLGVVVSTTLGLWSFLWDTRVEVLHSGSEVFSQIEEIVPEFRKKHFASTFLLPFSWMQRAWLNSHPPYHIELVPQEEEGLLWANLHPRVIESERMPIAMIYPGPGEVLSPSVLAQVMALRRHQFRVAVVKKDSHRAVGKIQQRYPRAPLYLVGFTEGGPEALKASLHAAGRSNLRGLALVSACLSPADLDALPQVASPVLILHAKDDSVCSLETMPLRPLHSRPNFFLVFTPQGGHGQFLSGRKLQHVG